MSRNKKHDDPKCNAIRQELRMVAYKRRGLKFYNFLQKKEYEERRKELLMALNAELRK